MLKNSIIAKSLSESKRHVLKVAKRMILLYLYCLKFITLKQFKDKYIFKFPLMFDGQK